MPPLLVGRSEPLEAFQEALETGAHAPGRTVIYTGARGTGKTVLLNAVEDLARERGWEVISETLTEGLHQTLTEDRLPQLLSRIDPDAVRMLVTGMSGPWNVGVTLDADRQWEPRLGLRSLLTLACQLLAERGGGPLITVDELHNSQVTSFRELATAVQHLRREEAQIAFAGAGLPRAVDDLLNDAVLTFLRRAERFELGTLTPAQAAEAIATPIRKAGRSPKFELSEHR